MSEAKILHSTHGTKPEGEGWFVLNAKEAEWTESPHFGSFVDFQGDVRFDQFGLNLHVLQPGQPACKYHSEAHQEGFLVLNGTCRLLVNGEERALKAWDYFHCPPGTEHVFVGGEEGPCTILMVGSRIGDSHLNYPKNALAAKYGASAEETTPDPRVAYEGLRDRHPIAAPDFDA